MNIFERIYNLLKSICKIILQSFSHLIHSNTPESIPSYQQFNIKSVDQIIALMEIYLDEWKYRDAGFCKQVFKYFYVNFIVTVLPNIASFLKINLPNINPDLFPIIGMIMAFVFLYLGLSDLVRTRAIGDTYVRLMGFLRNEKCRRIQVNGDTNYDMFGIFDISRAFVMVWAMFFLQIFIAVVLLIYSDDVEPFIIKM